VASARDPQLGAVATNKRQSVRTHLHHQANVILLPDRVNQSHNILVGQRLFTGVSMEIANVGEQGDSQCR
jgi:hypothetical protein